MKHTVRPSVSVWSLFGSITHGSHTHVMYKYTVVTDAMPACISDMYVCLYAVCASVCGSIIKGNTIYMN